MILHIHNDTDALDLNYLAVEMIETERLRLESEMRVK